MKQKKVLFILLISVLFSSCSIRTDDEIRTIAVTFLEERLASPELLDYKIKRNLSTYDVEVNATKAWKTKQPNVEISFPLFIEIDTSNGQVISFL